MKSFVLLHESQKVHYKNYLLLLVLCLLCFWPLTFEIASVKNDAIQYFLPFRYNIVEALRTGEWPFWNPYIYLGYPIHGDMQSGAWNPFVWLLSLFGNYNLTRLHAESLLYVFLGGIAMYKLTLRYVNHSKTSLIIGASYMLSGFMLSGQLINWLASAAFLPFVLNYYLLAIKKSSVWPAIKTGISLFLLFTTGYPSFFIFSCYLLLGIFIISLSSYFYKPNDPAIKSLTFFRQHFIIILIFAGLSMPAIISFIDLLPYYRRGSDLSYQESLSNSFALKHLISLIFPLTIGVKDGSSGTDITMRNVYAGIFTLCFLISLPPRLTRNSIMLISLALFSLLFSLGDVTPVKKICYDFVPFMNSFRHPAQFRLYFILAILLLAAPGIKKWVEGHLSKKESQILYRTTIIIAAGLIFTIIVTSLQSEIFSKISDLFSSTAGFRIRLKAFLDNISLSEALLINAIIQLFFIAALLYILKKKILQEPVFIFIWLLNLFVCAQLVMPLTFIKQSSPKKANQVIATIQKRDPVKILNNSLFENSKDAYEYFDDIGLSYFYNKKIGISNITNSPAFLNKQEIFILNKFLYNYISQQPVVYLADSVIDKIDSSILSNRGSNCTYVFLDSGHINSVKCKQIKMNKPRIIAITNNSFTISSSNSASSCLVLSQNYHHHWKAWINGKPQEVLKVNIAFMGLPLTTGRNLIIFKYVPTDTYYGMIISGITILILAVWCLVSLQKRTFKY